MGWSDGSEGPRESSGKRELYANQFKEHHFDSGFMRKIIFIIIITTPSNKQWNNWHVILFHKQLYQTSCPYYDVKLS